MAENKDPNEKDQNKNDDDFGMPKVDITPIGENPDASKASSQPTEADKRPEEVPVTPGPVEEKPEKEEKSRSGFFIILLLLLLFGAGFALYYMGVFDRSGESSPPTSSGPAPAEEPVEEEVPPAPEELAEDSGPVEEETFFLTEITSKINVPRYFVVVGSFIDPDLAKDYSNRLNNMNKSTFLIHPYGDISFYRLAVGQHDSLSEAISHMEDIQGDFEENLWVLNY
jgi:hypothetical protein